jgi:hypothetical protein
MMPTFAFANGTLTTSVVQGETIKCLFIKQYGIEIYCSLLPEKAKLALFRHQLFGQDYEPAPKLVGKCPGMCMNDLPRNFPRSNLVEREVTSRHPQPGKVFCQDVSSEFMAIRVAVPTFSLQVIKKNRTD